jgi:hypothetical protein
MIVLCFPLAAQEEEEEPDQDEEIPINSDWAEYTPFVYSKGDQILAISLGVFFPTVFAGNSGIIDHNLFVLGAGLSLNYNYFLTPRFFLGGEVQAWGITSIAKNWLYMVPFGLKLGYQLTLHRTRLPLFLRRLEFPFSLMIGGAVQSYLNNEENYLGLFLKGGAGLFFRFNQDWSFGLNAAWWWVPQWTKDSAKDVHGNFVEVTLSARYHL